MTARSFSIRQIREGDWGVIDQIQRAAFAKDAVEDIATIRRLGELAPELCLLAEAEEAVGYLIAHPWVADDLPPLNTMIEGLPEGAETLFIHDLALLPEQRGKGVAPALVTAIFEKGRALGLRDASLIAIQNSQGFWARMGFRERPDLADKVRPVLERFLKTDFVFMTRPNLQP